MKYILKSIVLAVLVLSVSVLPANTWQGKWIVAAHSKDTVNSWFAFRKHFNVDKIPHRALANIAADSKYWMTINGETVVFEGGLKRGPNSRDTYFDQIDIAPFLKKGKNVISIKLWYFGKEGFSHNSSGKAGLIFDCKADGFTLLSNASWQAWPLEAYQTAPEPHPNFRLPESSILYDARLEYADWETSDQFPAANRQRAVETGPAGSAPWNNLVIRPIPFWRDFGLKDYPSPYERRGDTIICTLPYNAQFTPYFKVKAKAGQRIKLVTDNYLYYNGSDDNIRAEYIAKEGIQEYESLGWLNGHKMYYIIPEDVEIIDLKYRETGYDTEFVGSFSSDDTFFNKLWDKARRTLYVTMRDTYMDCPDRERAQWTGDAVLEAEEAFYALSPSSHLLTKKWLYEIVGWQREDGSLFAPVPAGNWSKEVPGQILATVGYYGIWTYYLHTADLNTVKDLYPGIQRYLNLWEFDGKGLVKIREGGWNWGDWGENKDMFLIYNLWYYMAMKGNYLMALELNKREDAKKYLDRMSLMKKEFNARFWNGSSYRNPEYTGKTDDRVHALAVLSGVADADKYPHIMQVFSQEEHASPYMEKYVFEAMYQMGFPAEANNRHKKRFSEMVNNDYFTTLFEGWGIGNKGYGGGTVNHAWSGGGLTILSSYLCGIRPVEPGYKVFTIAPQPGSIKNASAEIVSVAGKISSSFENDKNNFNLSVAIPVNSKALVTLPPYNYRTITLNGKSIYDNGNLTESNDYEIEVAGDAIQITLADGSWTINTSYK